MKIKVQRRFFYKLYKNSYEEIFKDMHPITLKVFMFFVYNMHHMDNSVSVSGVYPSQDVLVEKCGVTKSMYKKAVRELLQMNLISSQRKSKFNKITVHPFMCEDSKTSEDVWDLFNK
jgi:DNA-binding MarR family transcriptional regulator